MLNAMTKTLLFFKNNFENLTKVLFYLLPSSKSTLKASPSQHPLTMNSIDYACSLNNQGVDLLVSGESSRAIKTFQSALSLLQAVHETFDTTSCTEMNVSSCNDASLPFYESASTVSGLQSPHCYVYDHGLMISGNVNGDTNEETISLHIAIVLFNSALASHSEGTALGQEKSLMKASALYSLVAQVFDACTILENTSTSILILLAMNNKAQIHYDQCNYVQSVDCMQQISKILISVRDVYSVFDHNNLEQILLNAILMITPTAAPAA
jgi:hypothetical protein